MPQAIIRYGIMTDSKGEPVRKNARRVVQEMVDGRDTEDEDTPKIKEGAKSWSKAPVRQEHRIIEGRNAIIARRGTNEGPDGEAPLTFTPNEVIGKFGGARAALSKRRTINEPP